MIGYDEIQAKSDEFGIHVSDVQRDYVFGWLIAASNQHPTLQELLVLKGGNVFRKAYFPATRFSDDLDFSTSEDLGGFDIVGAFNEVCEAAGAASGVRFDLDRNRLVDEQQLDSERRVLKLRLYFHDFTGTTQELILKVRVDITELDRLVLPVQTRQLIHPYSDWESCNAPIRCVKLEEALADKLRALMQRQYSHDLFDLVYAVFLGHELDVNRVEIVRTFLSKSVFERDARTPRQVLLALPFELMRGFWDKIVLPQITRLSFDDAVARFTAGLAELFAPFATPERTAVGYFPAEYRASILRAGTDRTLMRLRYNDQLRVIEPYALAFKRRQDGLVKEYFYAWDRTGGSKGPSIKSFWPERVQALENTDEPFTPRFPVELTKEGSLDGGTFARPFSSRPRSPRSARPRASTPVSQRYRLRCTYCNKIFYRGSTRSTRLNAHKDSYGNRCAGRVGYWI